ncbi:MAG: ATP-binding cassette domain-containing protein [Pseudobdellovibrionaceae bacterium]|nr:ATP-binding cassette domain-containing protein [Bdellovibrionales bacterium]USN48295.1 MAG: ATP-binding cassette domain-containing protein [Pseudobdellovibrionaceae bacterium]
MTTPVIELQNVTIELGGQIILEDISLQVMPGECLVVVGPSGQGKTVLLKTIVGIYKPKTGRVFINGQDLNSFTQREKRELARRVGMLFQQNALFDSLTAVENVAFPIREHTTMSDVDVVFKSAYFLKAVGLEDSAFKYPHELSGGMQRRLGIARALALDPDIVLYDDPTAGQDPIRSDNMAQLILKLKQSNNGTIVVVTNDMFVAYEMADRIIMVTQRQIIDTGTVEQTKSCPEPRVQQFINGQLTGPLTENGTYVL